MKVIIAQGKHGTEVYGNALALLKERAEWDWYDYAEEYEWIINSNDEAAAWSYLVNRRDYEYEYVQKVDVKE